MSRRPLSPQNQAELPTQSLVKMFALDPEQDIELMSSKSPGKSDDRRVLQLRQLLLSQLDLIQKQSEVIVAKDQQIKELRSENECLNDKISELVAASKEKSEKSRKSKTSSKQQQKEIVVEEVEKQDEPIDEQNDDENFEMEMETEEPYFTLQNEFDENEIDVEQTDKNEIVPGFRLKPIPPSYVMEGTENIEDETLLKRHQKPENDEKRRKRWDVQRIREQRHVARLKARFDPNNELKGSLDTMPIDDNFSQFNILTPNPEDAEEIVVQDKLPVSVFGCVLPNLGIKDFSLPWLTQ